MLEFILVAAALGILLIAGILLAKGYKKEQKTEYSDENKSVFDTKYDEVVYLYKSGAINEDEYKQQMKNIIN